MPLVVVEAPPPGGGTGGGGDTGTGTGGGTTGPGTGLGIPIETCHYTTYRGAVVDLSTVIDKQYKEGVDGRFMPEIEHTVDENPGRDGARWRGSRALPRLLTIPLTIESDNMEQLRGLVREFAATLRPLDPPGTLRVITTDGLDRSIRCGYESGLQSGVDLSEDGVGQRIELAFRAWDPFWYDTTAVPIAPITPGLKRRAFFPLTPVLLGTSSIFAVFTQNNTGDIATSPTWAIHGPGSGITLTNITTGETFKLAATLGQGVTVSIDAGTKKIHDQYGMDLFRYTSGPFWSFEPGANQIQIRMSNTTDETFVQLAYSRQWYGV